MIVLVDMDGVIADVEEGFYNSWRNRYPERIGIPPKDRTTHKPQDQYPKEYFREVRALFEEKGFYSGVPEVEGAGLALREMSTSGLDVYICSSPLSEYSFVAEKYFWIGSHLGEEWMRRTILVKDKTLVRGDVLIDDKPQVSGFLEPTWEHVLYDQPYNRGVVGKRRLTWENWRRVLGV